MRATSVKIGGMLFSVGTKAIDYDPKVPRTNMRPRDWDVSGCWDNSWFPTSRVCFVTAWDSKPLQQPKVNVALCLDVFNCRLGKLEIQW